jgi:hypothetical protein
MMSSSGGSSAPDSSSQSRRMRRATGEVAWSTSSSWISEVSRAAVLARMVATPSRRLSSSARAASVTAVSALTRARSSRTRKAMTWNLTRFVGPSLPRWALASTSRTLRARIGMIGASSSRREDEDLRRRCADVWAGAVGGMLLLSVSAGDAGDDRCKTEILRAPAGGACAVTNAGREIPVDGRGHSLLRAATSSADPLVPV